MVGALHQYILPDGVPADLLSGLDSSSLARDGHSDSTTGNLVARMEAGNDGEARLDCPEICPDSDRLHRALRDCFPLAGNLEVMSAIEIEDIPLFDVSLGEEVAISDGDRSHKRIQ